METRLCVDCKHCIRGPIHKRLTRPNCALTKRVTKSSDVVQGGPDSVRYTSCYDERAYGCGREGKNFEPKRPKRFSRIRKLFGR